MKKASPKYSIKNWPTYNKSLKQRGSLEIWIEEGTKESWYAQPNGKKGAQPVYSDTTIKTILTLGKVFHQKLRQTQGLCESLLGLMNLDLKVPDYTTLSRRASELSVELRKVSKEKTVLIVDSTGLKVYGEGEWKVRKHGAGKRRTWRKFHVGVDEGGEIRVCDLTGNDTDDAEVVEDLLQQEEGEIEAFYGDGAYDKRKVYQSLKKRKVDKILIPPQINARIWKHGNKKGPPHPRDENLRQIRKSTRKQWKKKSGYHKRSLSETAMFRIKTIFTPVLHSRKMTTQKTEALIMASALNRMTALGMPKTEVVMT